MSHFHITCIHPRQPLQSLLGYFSSENVSSLPFFVIFSFSFLYSFHPLTVFGPDPLQHSRGKSIHRTLKLNFRQLCFSDHLVPSKTATSQRQGLLASIFHPVPRNGGCSVSESRLQRLMVTGRATQG